MTDFQPAGTDGDVGLLSPVSASPLVTALPSSLMFTESLPVAARMASALSADVTTLPTWTILA